MQYKTQHNAFESPLFEYYRVQEFIKEEKNRLLLMKKKFDSNPEYHSAKGISASGLKKIYKTTVTDFLTDRVQKSKAMEFGSAVHIKLLEPENYSKDVYVMPKIDKRTSTGKTEAEIHRKRAIGKIVIDTDEQALIDEIVAVTEKNPDIQYYLQGDRELSHYGRFKGVSARCRPDIINYDKKFIADVKTCQNPHPYAFRSDVYKWAYHLQASFYCDFTGIPIENFRFICINARYVKNQHAERVPLASVSLIQLNSELMEAGRVAYTKAIENWKFYKDTGVCPGYIWDNIDDDNSLII